MSLEPYEQAKAAIDARDLEALEAIFAAHAGLAAARSAEHGGNLLHDAAYKNDVEICRFLVEAGCSTSEFREKRCVPDAPHAGSGSQTPLAYALETNARAAAAYLASVEVVPDNLWTAASLGDLERLRSFWGSDGKLQADACDPNKAGDDTFVVTDAMVGAAHQGKTEAAVFLLDRGADPSGRDQFGMTALHYAVQGNVELTELLLERGADVRVRDWQFDATPYGWAKYQGRTTMMKLLRSRCDLDPTDLEGS